ncbi:MAG: hypothetical protein IJZ80_11190 [Clostridia bacterium]|nr:hypothetical protein [Clostridia bacterium]
MKKTIRILSFLMFLLLVFTTAGVYAIWSYGVVVPDPIDLSISLNIPPPVEWTDKDILPAEHARLLEIFIQEINKPDSIVYDHLYDRFTGLLGLGLFTKYELGSMDEDGAPLRKLFSIETSAFILDFDAKRNYVWGSGWQITYNSFDMYTTEIDLSTLSPGDKVSPVYKTTVTKNTETGLWELGQSIKGEADFSYYDEEGTWQNETIPSFDTDSWREISE